MIAGVVTEPFESGAVIVVPKFGPEMVTCTVPVGTPNPELGETLTVTPCDVPTGIFALLTATFVSEGSPVTVS